jgi:hypothetical protein
MPTRRPIKPRGPNGRACSLCGGQATHAYNVLCRALGIGTGGGRRARKTSTSVFACDPCASADSLLVLLRTTAAAAAAYVDANRWKPGNRNGNAKQRATPGRPIARLTW